MKHVLIVDNDPDVLDIVREGLSYSGLKVTCTDGGDDIFKLIDRYHPDLLLVDYLLNGVNGAELCKELKESPKTHHLPVVILSAYPRFYMSAGVDICDDFIEKPFDLDDMVERIKKLTDKKKGRGLHAV